MFTLDPSPPGFCDPARPFRSRTPIPHTPFLHFACCALFHPRDYLVHRRSQNVPPKASTSTHPHASPRTSFTSTNTCALRPPRGGSTNGFSHTHPHMRPLARCGGSHFYTYEHAFPTPPKWGEPQTLPHPHTYIYMRPLPHLRGEPRTLPTDTPTRLSRFFHPQERALHALVSTGNRCLSPRFCLVFFLSTPPAPSRAPSSKFRTLHWGTSAHACAPFRTPHTHARRQPHPHPHAPFLPLSQTHTHTHTHDPSCSNEN